MKIMFTFKPRKSCYGGGSCFVKNITKFLMDKHYEIVYILQPNIDLIFIIDPRRGKNKKYSINDIINYKKNNPKVKIIHRINENDIKRKKSINIEPLLLKGINIADHVVFVSNWLQNYFINKYKLNIKSSYIINGCNTNIFYPIKKQLNNKIKLITHHWSDNYLKGFYIYNKIDKLLEKRKDIEFTYVGRYYKGYKPKNINIISPTNGKKLANIIRNHDIYITATQNEPGAMHYIEGLSCGLPVIYCSGGGGVKEVCNPYGEEFHDIDTMLLAINKIMNNYQDYVSKINYKYLSSERCNFEYNDLIKIIC